MTNYKDKARLWKEAMVKTRRRQTFHPHDLQISFITGYEQALDDIGQAITEILKEKLLNG